MLQKREQMWWAGACGIGLLVAAWAAGGFLGPLMAVFIVVFLAGAVLLEVEGRDRTEGVRDRPAESESADVVMTEDQRSAVIEPEAGAGLGEVASREAEADIRANSLT